MNSLAYVNQQIEVIKKKGAPIADEVWETALLCIGWPYIFGDRGQECTPSRRKSVHNSHPDQTGLIDKCQVLKDSAAGCSGCKWFPGEKRVGSFDCRGFTYWCLLQFGIKVMGTGCTSQWNDNNNWDAKGTIDSIPDDKLVCLFYTDKKNPKVMAHTGFGYRGETIECGNGVQHFTVRNKKWTHWAIPKGIYDGESVIIPPTDTSVKLPTLQKGSKGSYVSLLQTLLLNRGYQLPKYGADGSFGNETVAAVKLFQKDWGLKVTGIVNEETWNVLESSQEHPKMYTVVIPHRTREEAEILLKQYPGTMTLENQ